MPDLHPYKPVTGKHAIGTARKPRSPRDPATVPPSQRDRSPWHMGAFRLPPEALREAVRRAVYLIDTKQAYILRIPAKKSPIEQSVRHWAQGIGCTPEQWAELVKVCA